LTNWQHINLTHQPGSQDTCTVTVHDEGGQWNWKLALAMAQQPTTPGRLALMNLCLRCPNPAVCLASYSNRADDGLALMPVACGVARFQLQQCAAATGRDDDVRFGVRSTSSPNPRALLARAPSTPTVLTRTALAMLTRRGTRRAAGVAARTRRGMNRDTQSAVGKLERGRTEWRFVKGLGVPAAGTSC